MRQRTQGVFPELDHKTYHRQQLSRLKTLQLKITNYASKLSHPSPQKSKSVEHYEKLRKLRQKRLHQENKGMVTRILHSNSRAEFGRSDSNQAYTKQSIQFYVRKNMLRQQMLYRQNLKIIDRITNCQSEVGRLGQCWIDLSCENYGKLHSKYRKDRGHLIWRKLELFEKARTPRSPISQQPKDKSHGCFLTTP